MKARLVRKSSVHVAACFIGCELLQMAHPAGTKQLRLPCRDKKQAVFKVVVDIMSSEPVYDIYCFGA